MIEGLRIAPWLHEATRRNPSGVAHLSDCGRCMRETPIDARRALACAYEKPIDGARGYEPPGYDGPPLATCPGYTTKLPEVREAGEARFYLKSGSLGLLVRGELTDGIREAIGALEGAEADVISWSMRNPENK